MFQFDGNLKFQMRSGHFILENVLYNIPLFFFYNYATVSGMKF